MILGKTYCIWLLYFFLEIRATLKAMKIINIKVKYRKYRKHF